MIGAKIVLAALCLIPPLVFLPDPAQEDPAEEEKPARIIFVTGCTQIRGPEVRDIDKKIAKAKAREEAVSYIHGFDFEYVQKDDAATVVMRSSGTIKTGESLAFKPYFFKDVYLLACTIDVHLDWKTVTRMAEEQEETERVPIEVLLTPRRARFSPVSRVITEALKKHYRKIAAEGGVVKGRGWLEGEFKLEKVETEDQGEMLKASLTLRLPDLEEK